jgi:hypothetical protein
MTTDFNDIDDILLEEQEESEKLNEQFEAGGNGHDEKEESQTPRADEYNLKREVMGRILPKRLWVEMMTKKEL